MSQISVSLFRTFIIRSSYESLIGFNSQKVKELFCYLLFYRQRPHLREMLLDQLWIDSPARQSKKYLRQALWQLQSGLKNHSDIILIDQDWIQIHPNAQIDLDVAKFELVFECVSNCPGHALTPQNVIAVEQALQLYRGDLLEGWYQDWCVFERTRMQDMYLRLLDKMMSYMEGQQRYEEGIEYGICILRRDHARERTHRRLMRIRALAGDRTGALRQFERLTAVLHAELSVEPSETTKQLYFCIQSDFPIQSVNVPPQTSRPQSHKRLQTMLSKLNQLQGDMQHTQQHMQQVINSLQSHV